MKDSLGREIGTADGKPPSVANLPVTVYTPSGPQPGWMNGNIAVTADKKST
jgi:hypothetical protein